MVLEAPTVSFDATYYLGDGFNEQSLGFLNNSALTKGFASGHMTASSGKNFYIVTATEGQDAIDNKSNTSQSVIGIGNAYLTDYTLDASVGAIPTVSVSFEAANINSQADASGSSAGYSGILTPAVTQADGSKLTDDIALSAAVTGVGAVSALRPGDINLTFGTAASDDQDGPIVDISGDADGVHVQSASLSLGTSRSPLERLGSRFPFARTVDFPVNATLSVSAIVNEISAANLADMIDSENAFEVNLQFQNRANDDVVAAYKMKGARLVSESISSSIGSNKTVDFNI